VASLFSLLLTQPIKRITDATKKLAGGEFGVSLPVRDRSEIGSLARSFQGMVEQVRKRDEELREREARLRKANEELEVARDQAMEANRTKSQFLASMSHE